MTCKLNWAGLFVCDPHHRVLVHEQPGTANPEVKVFVVDTDNITNIAQAHVPAVFQNL